MRRPSTFSVLAVVSLAGTATAVEHPSLLFSRADLPGIVARAKDPLLAPVAKSLLDRASYLLTAAPLEVSPTLRGEADPPGELKGLEAARRLQGRVLTFCMAFTLTGDRRYLAAAVAELDHALGWKVWVDTAHPPPYDLTTGELSLTFGLAYDWLYNDLSPEQRQRLGEGADRRGLAAYLQAADRPDPPWWLHSKNNWNVVCNGGAALLALALGETSARSDRVLALALPGMDAFWNHLAADGGWDEGTGYWTYAMRYALIAAEVLRRAGNPWAAKVFARPGLARTGYFPMVFNPGRELSASFGDSNGRAADPVLYLLAREFKNGDFVWFEDRAGLRGIKSEGEGWPREALELLWRPLGEKWLPEARPGYVPSMAPTQVFPDIGWGLMAPNQPDPRFFLAFKSGSLAANHTHLDLNHVSLGYGDTMLLAELGSRPYPADYFGPKRYTYYEQSTAGHNTVLVQGRGQLLKRAGKLLGPNRGAGLEELVGTADEAYEIPTTRARRHVVFVDQAFWVIFDEIETPEPRSAELRYHSYGRIAADGPGRWTITRDAAALDLATWSPEELAGVVGQPGGWIEPVNVLSLKAPPAAAHQLVTVLYPRSAGAPKLAPVSCKATKDRIEVDAGGRTVAFVRGADGWATEGVGQPDSATRKRVDEAPSPR